MDAIQLSVFSSRIAAICDEMGAMLRSAALSPNIKDRLDFSCAVFDAEGQLCAQAAHIPVHLGSMAYAMAGIVGQLEWRHGDMVIVNDPFLGGTHLPDVTLIAPVFVDEQLLAFVCNRAHHADIGASTPGSMPISKCLEEEGLIIPPSYLIRMGAVDEAFLDSIVSATGNAQQSRGDFSAQISANRAGVQRLTALIDGLGLGLFRQSLVLLNDYAERLSATALQQIPDGEYRFSDVMDDDGMGNRDILIQASVKVCDGFVRVDFDGTAEQVQGNINCPLSVAAAAVYYVFRCLMPVQTPACAGSFRRIQLCAPLGCLVNAKRPAAVAAGNVETSTRIVDVIMGALAEAIPAQIPAASHGSMNNVAMGARGEAGQNWDYYETLGGGMGAGASHAGLSALQTHMTNTLNTPVESLEMHYPLRILRYQVRRGSGGQGKHVGGDGLIREYEFLAPTTVTLLTERRQHSPWGLNGGQPGLVGENGLDGDALPAKISFTAKTGQRLLVSTPGAGGWGLSDSSE
ncbi:MAG TPA: hydantoinase B/oxoprolinase family protein [Candidatus Tenderia electrophaga]|uniref:Hydantoinase B/oxoprolinase family protein n=1 Tax=Candidatus Tenderia electrophaga TaxID=1748243 RepID=A0A832J2I9_9GAMM|nr:hydantoinase B/oxoprolinase family protein [Candidatus Tenderia electrophaga]